MTTLITGGAGLIGSAVTEVLLDRGESVVCFDLDGASPPEGARFVAGDVRDYESVAGAIEEHEPDDVVHLAAIIGSRTNEVPTESLYVNAVGTDNVFRAAREHDLSRVVWTSTLGVYGPGSSYPDDSVSEETVTPAAYNLYPASSFYRAMKQLNEYQSRMYRAEHGVDAYAVRPSVVFGPERDRGWQGRFIDDAVREGESTIGRPPDAELPLVYVTDVADLVVAVLRADAPRHEVYNTGSTNVTARELADAVEHETGATVRCDEDAPPKAAPSVIGNQWAVDEFGYSLTPLADAVADYVDRIS